MGEAEGRDLAPGEEAMDSADPGHHEASAWTRTSERSLWRSRPKNLREIDEAASKIEAQGARLPPAVLAMSGR